MINRFVYAPLPGCKHNKTNGFFNCLEGQGGRKQICVTTVLNILYVEIAVAILVLDS